MGIFNIYNFDFENLHCLNCNSIKQNYKTSFEQWIEKTHSAPDATKKIFHAKFKK